MYSSPNDNWEAENFARTHWTAEVLSSEEKFRAETERISRGVYECYTFGSPHAARFLYRCFSAASDFIREEPFLSILEHHIASAAGMLAVWHISEHRFDEALPLIDKTWKMLDAKDSRRQLLDLPARPSTEARLILLAAIADCKWRLPSDVQRDLILTPTQQINVWLTYHDRISAWCANHETSEERKRQNSERLLSAGLYVSICGMRFVPSLLQDVVDLFNGVHTTSFGSIGLALPLRHWQSDSPPDPATNWYWQFEIAKLWLHFHNETARAAEPDDGVIAEIGMLYDKLVATARVGDWARENGIYLASVIRDRNWMVSVLRARQLNIALLAEQTS